jgi:hypothetical protein
MKYTIREDVIEIFEINTDKQQKERKKMRFRHD